MAEKRPADEPGFVDELTDPLAALPRYFGQAEYDPRSLRPVVGPAVTAARRGALGLVGRALRVATERQDRVNRLVTRMLELLDQRSAPAVDRRLVAVEDQLRAAQSAEQVRDLELTALAQSLGLADELDGVDLAPLAAVFAGTTDLLAIGSVALAARLGARLADADAGVVRAARERGIEALQLEPEVHVRSAADGSIGGAAAFGVAERIGPGHLLVLLRQLRRALRPGATLAVIALDATALGERFWLDPRRTRPAPRALVASMLEAAGFEQPSFAELPPAAVAVIARRA
ncbi:MAG TPA: hypothetical protein VGT60_04545 [Candidatus Limnocylindria bacterium]|nr:hypothetical protein [Candidatus Limnocylindria bacterium]